MTATRINWLETLSEKDWQSQVIAWAERAGWRVYHTYDSRRSVAGFPDLVLVKAGRAIQFIELKTIKGRVTPAQQGWLDAISASVCTPVARVWRPSDEDEVRAVLGITRGVAA